MAQKIFELFDNENCELLQVPRNLREAYREIFLDGDSGSELKVLRRMTSAVMRVVVVMRSGRKVTVSSEVH